LIKYKTKIIVNPHSAFGKTKKRWNKIKSFFSTIFKELRYEFTEAPKHAIDITKDAIFKGFNYIIGVGGDGTLNEIINGYMENDKPLNEKVIVSTFPSGKGNDFYRSFSSKMKTNKLRNTYLYSKNKKIDIGKLKSSTGETYFINISSFGLSGDVVNHISHLREKIKTGLVYFLGALISLKKYKANNLRIKINNNNIIEGRFFLGAVCNGKYFGGNMKINPGSVLDDGFLNLILLENTSKLNVLKKLIKVYKGSHINDPEIILTKAKNIKVESLDSDVKMEYDGEKGGSLPAEFYVIPSVVNFKI